MAIKDTNANSHDCRTDKRERAIAYLRRIGEDVTKGIIRPEYVLAAHEYLKEKEQRADAQRILDLTEESIKRRNVYAAMYDAQMAFSEFYCLQRRNRVYILPQQLQRQLPDGTPFTIDLTEITQQLKQITL